MRSAVDLTFSMENLDKWKIFIIHQIENENCERCYSKGFES